jgi:predicted lipoprotein with Yx(FWY)xxD motif
VAKTGLGDSLVDSHGRTLYLFKADPSLVGSTARSDGKPQVTYNGHPLYLYVDDQKPGDTNGQGVKAFGARWFALTPSGTQISSRPSAGSGGVSGY